MSQEITIRINSSSFVRVTKTHLHYKFGVVNETEKIISLERIKSTNYTPVTINKAQSGCNIIAGILGGIGSGDAFMGDVETKFPVLAIEYYPEGHQWPKILQISQPSLSKKTADEIIAAIESTNSSSILPA